MSEPADNESLRSPFEGQRVSIPAERRPKIFVGATIGFVALLVLGGALFFLGKVVNDPLRTLKDFPIEDYYQNPQGLEGTRFKATLRPKGQVGWKEEVGRLIIFDINRTSKPLVILVTPADENIAFDQNQTYMAELQVKQGGLVTASHISLE